MHLSSEESSVSHIHIFHQQLPSLKTLIIEGGYAPPVEQFADSIIQCPNIEKLFAHKYYASKMPALYLPKCRDFTFRRADSLRELPLYLPVVETLTLDGCYSLEYFALYSTGHDEHKNPCPTTFTKFRLSIANVDVKPDVLWELENNSSRIANRDYLMRLRDGADDKDGGKMGMDGLFRKMRNERRN